MDGRWVNWVESALRANPAYADAEIVNFGLASETTSGLSEQGHAGGAFPRPCVHERLGRVLGAFKPTLVTACYGINDGIYLPLDDERFKAFKDGMTKLKTEVEKSGARFIAITPPLYAADKPSADPKRYDAVMDAYASWLVKQRSQGWKVIDMRPALKKAVAEAKKADPKFVYSGDSVHPGDQGHLFIAQAIWPELAKMLKLSKTPQFAQGPALATLMKRQGVLRDAWLTDTGHERPDVPGYREPGTPAPTSSALPNAMVKAAELLTTYNAQK
jgi:lysophospholipase L1-like esterase